MIGIAGDVAGVAVGDPAGRMGEDVPIGLPAPILVDRALDLIGGGRAAPAEIGREAELDRRRQRRAAS